MGCYTTVQGMLQADSKQLEDKQISTLVMKVVVARIKLLTSGFLQFFSSIAPFLRRKHPF